MIVSTVWLGLLGFLDDYNTVFRHNKEGLKGKFKIVGQVGIGIIVGTVMFASPEVVVRDKVVEPVQQRFVDDDGEVSESVTTNRVVMGTESVKTTQTTIPFGSAPAHLRRAAAFSAAAASPAANIRKGSAPCRSAAVRSSPQRKSSASNPHSRADFPCAPAYTARTGTGVFRKKRNAQRPA